MTRAVGMLALAVAALVVAEVASAAALALAALAVAAFAVPALAAAVLTILAGALIVAEKSDGSRYEQGRQTTKVWLRIDFFTLSTYF